MSLRYQVAWFAVLMGLLLTSLGMSWWLHAEFNYGYALWYDWLDLRGQIAEFGPQNRYIQGFQTLSREGHLAAFNAIVQAVHGPAGSTVVEALRQIHFMPSTGHATALLREPEIVHLNDVAVLMARLRAALIGVAILTVFGQYRLRRRVPLIRWRWQGGLLLCLALAGVLLLALLGFEAVFYQLHHWVFPENHAWFFYYQDSLMSTMMKAPDLFAAIGASLLGFGLILFALMVGVLRRMTKSD